jgi:oxygen-independent coproporphyrinogen-3 oxidase
MTGIYIHVPFCLRKCPYCDFYSVAYDADLAERYVQAVCRNIESHGNDGISADTVYFGGGTPSLLTAEQVYKILDCVQKNVHLYNPEITLEANPCSTDCEKLSGWKTAGVNRLSFGVQSADDRQLEFLGRLHDCETAEKAVINAEKAGFDNISCDLMLGLSGQDGESLDFTLDRLLSLPISHLSAYMLKIEQGTAFDRDEIRNVTADEDEMCDLYLRLCDRMKSMGWEHYEISNFAKNGRRSRHNMKYWTLAPYIGIGSAAHSYYKGKRTACPKNLHDFINSSVQKNVLTDEQPDRLEEYIMLSLRISDGISKERLADMAGEDYAERLFSAADMLKKNGLAQIDGDRLSLTDRGFLLSNSIIVYLLDC